MKLQERRWSVSVGVVVAAALVVLVSAAQAVPGDLDPTFGAGGKVTTDFGGVTDEGHAVALQSDGRIVVGGFTSGPTLDFALARYLSDGTLDNSFGTGGKVITAFPGSLAFINVIAVQSDGKIVAVGGTSNEEFALARYNPDGTLDPSFGADGLVVTNVGFGGYAFSAALQADGKIVVVGQVFPRLTPQGYDVDFILARYETDGALDPDFGTDGIVLTDFQLVDVARAVAVQADGKIIAGGTSSTGSGGGTLFDFALARYNHDGSLDSGFGSSGKITTDFTDNAGASRGDVASVLTIQADGRIVAAGTSSPQGGASPTGPAFALARYNPDGTLDSSFGSGGQVMTDFGSGYTDDGATSAVLLPNGKIVLGGYTGIPAFPTTVQDFALARYNTNGSLDADFGNGGTVVTDFSAAVDTIRGLALQRDGKIVAAGVTSLSSTGGDTQFALARYLGTSADTTPPVITVPTDITVNATSPAGAVVEFTATATDENPANPTVTCTPPSGSVFAIGDTLVTCTAADAAGNTAAEVFSVHVKGAAEQLEELSDAVEGVGPGTSLRDKARDAQAALGRNDMSQACAILNAFINQVKAQTGKVISISTASSLIADATRITRVLDC